MSAPQRSETWSELASLVDALLDAPPEQRASLMEELSAGDPVRRSALERLQEEIEREPMLFRRPAAERFAALFDDDVAGFPETLAERYRLTRELGRGGMATVYLAHDLKHGRDVAVKVVHPALASALGPERFLREIEIAAQLHHPHIVQLYDSGAAGGSLYYVMPYEAGPSLRQRLARDGPLPVEEAVLVLRDVCDALAHAHAHGIIHRDIKPDNVLLSGRHAMVTDFGVAKAATAATAHATLTGAGIVLGTPAYMAPEQIGSDPRIDHRADIYAVGVLAYELLAGRPPFTDDAPQDMLSAHLTQAPLPIRTHRADVPEPLAELVMKSLEKRPADRWQTAAELVQRLDALAVMPRVPAPFSLWRPRWMRTAAAVAAGAAAPRPPSRPRRAALHVWAGMALLALLGVGMWPLLSRALPDGTPPTRERVLVADFVNRTTDSTYGDLVAHILRSELARSPRLSVVGREVISEALRRMRLGPDVRLSDDVAREVALREEIKVVIAGDVRMAGTGVVVSASVIEASSGELIHGASETARDSTEVLPAIERLSNSIREGTGESLASIQAGDSLWSVTTSSLPALRKHRTAMLALWRGDFLRSADLFEEAVALDPDFAYAYLGLATAMIQSGRPRGRVLPILVHAYELRDRLTERERYAIEGHFHLRVAGDVTQALHAFQKHIEALRQTGEGGWYGTLGHLLRLTDQLPAAEAVLQEARVRFPSTSNQVQLIGVLYALGKDAEARQVLDELSRRLPEHPRVLQVRVSLLADSGRYDEAHTLATRIREDFGRHNGLRLQAELDAVRGRFGEAVEHLRQFQAEVLGRGEPAVALEIAIAGARLRLRSGDSAGTSEVDELLRRRRFDSVDTLSRPYLPLAMLYAEAGQPRRARAWLDRYAREFPREFQGPDRWLLHRARAATLRAEGRLQEAMTELRQAVHIPAAWVGLFDDMLIPMSRHPELARLYEELGSPDSAIAVYERYLGVRELIRTTTDAFELGTALERLGDLYEQRGDRVRAAAARRRFAALWRNADAALQPRVERARRAVALEAPPGRAP